MHLHTLTNQLVLRVKMQTTTPGDAIDHSASDFYQPNPEYGQLSRQDRSLTSGRGSSWPAQPQPGGFRTHTRGVDHGL